MKSKAKNPGVRQNNAWTYSVSKERIIQVEERLNYRKAVSSCNCVKTLKQIAHEMFSVKP